MKRLPFSTILTFHLRLHVELCQTGVLLYQLNKQCCSFIQYMDKIKISFLVVSKQLERKKKKSVLTSKITVCLFFVFIFIAHNLSTRPFLRIISKYFILCKPPLKENVTCSSVREQL